jgi:hypothetical protein
VTPGFKVVEWPFVILRSAPHAVAIPNLLKGFNVKIKSVKRRSATLARHSYHHQFESRQRYVRLASWQPLPPVSFVQHQMHPYERLRLLIHQPSDMPPQVELCVEALPDPRLALLPVLNLLQGLHCSSQPIRMRLRRQDHNIIHMAFTHPTCRQWLRLVGHLQTSPVDIALSFVEVRKPVLRHHAIHSCKHAPCRRQCHLPFRLAIHHRQVRLSSLVEGHLWLLT